MITSKKWMVCIVALVFVVALTGGCKKSTPTPIDTGLDSTTTGTETTNNQGMNDDLELERLLWNKDTGLQIVYFDYNSFALRPDALKTLADNAEKIKQAPSAIIQIEGHCDERGTQEYNLALGEKRALAVRDHLIKLGVSGDRLVTISYGEERPAQEGHDESAWHLNRRSEFNKAV